MDLNFSIEYQTVFGEDLVLNIITENDNGSNKTSIYRMHTADGKRWQYNLHSNFKPGDTIVYYYSVLRGDIVERNEWMLEKHRLEMDSKKAEKYEIFDHWIDMPENSYLYSSAMTECINRHENSKCPKNNYDITLRIKVRAPQLRNNERLVVRGRDSVFGKWENNDSVPMYEHVNNEWIADIDISKLKERKPEFKFAILSKDNTLIWEHCENRTIELPDTIAGDVLVYELNEAQFPIQETRCAGTLVPVFSLRSQSSFGVGDFGDLKKMIDWVSQTGQSVLQILPINDTTTTHTWTDSYPYSCISIFAIHPQYADFTSLPQIKDTETREKFETLRRELNGLEQIDYERVNDAKTTYLHIIFEQEGKKIMASREFKKFFEDTQQWLVPYARYCYLRDKNGTADFSKWKDHNTWDENERKMLSTTRNKAYENSAFYYFVQFVLNSQMQAVHDYARNKGVILKGDIPIGVNRYGCDVWQEPKYFNLNGQAGAPPDDFSTNGQNWGFPTYNWEEMLKDGCIWWIRRFQNMSKFFDAYRIDHVLGFFRIWEIPANAVHGLLGQFSPSLGMSREEIEGYGLHFQEDFFTRPFIADWMLERIFREHTQDVKNKYLNHSHDDIWDMKPEYDTQKKIEIAFEGKTSDDDIWIRDGLYSLISDVLFVRDNRDKNKFHPRISVQYDFIYQTLYDSDKFVFNKLYNDYFYRRNNQFWYQEAMKKLPKLVEATRMMVCAEDLGMVPDCVAWVMNELHILSLELQSMPKDPKVRFGCLEKNPYRSVCTISSHDTPTLRQWWDEDWERTQNYYNTMLYRSDAAPHPLPGWLAKDIINRHLCSPSMLCILSVQDWLAIDENIRNDNKDAERINIPSNPKHYWRYRMHISIEDLMSDKVFADNIKELVSQSGREQ